MSEEHRYYAEISLGGRLPLFTSTDGTLAITDCSIVSHLDGAKMNLNHLVQVSNDLSCWSLFPLPKEGMQEDQLSLFAYGGLDLRMYEQR